MRRPSFHLFLAIAPLLFLHVAVATAQPRTAAKSPARPSCGALSGQLLKCEKFGFTYQVKYGWVDRTNEMNSNDDEDRTNADAKEDPDAGKSVALLAVFERPPGASGQDIDSAVVIAAESLADYPKVKTASDYFGPLSDVAEEDDFKVVKQPYAVTIGTKQLVRGDFNKQRGKQTMWQSSLVMIEKDEIVSFTFVGGSEDEIEQLIGNLKFGVATEKQIPRR